MSGMRARAAFCATCTSARGPFATRVFDGAAHAVCERCDREHPRDGGYAFGGDSLAEITRNWRGYLDQVRNF